MDDITGFFEPLILVDKLEEYVFSVLTQKCQISLVGVVEEHDFGGSFSNRFDSQLFASEAQPSNAPDGPEAKGRLSAG